MIVYRSYVERQERVLVAQTDNVLVLTRAEAESLVKQLSRALGHGYNGNRDTVVAGPRSQPYIGSDIPQ